MAAASLVDLAPLARVALLGAALALGPLAWLWLRQRRADPASRLRALTVLTLFLTFDLVLFGAFTRLTDSGLGCPDWPGCYGSASPLGARGDIAAAEQALPFGPVTATKAWIEMTHRYFATAVGVLISVLALWSWVEARRGTRRVSPWWPTLTLAWVIVQGAFGALTVTLKLYPAIVTLHQLGGLGLLVLLTVQSRPANSPAHPPALELSPGRRRGLWWLAGISLVQIALGGWVSTNHAVLACAGFPRCQGSWWPAMDFAGGFAVLRELGTGAGGAPLRFEALVAIHFAHRLFAVVVLAGMGALAVGLVRGGPAMRRWALGVAALAVWQLGTGMLNVLFDWPLAAAVGHTAGAAAWVVLLTWLLAASPRRQAAAHARRTPSRPIGSAS